MPEVSADVEGAVVGFSSGVSNAISALKDGDEIRVATEYASDGTRPHAFIRAIVDLSSRGDSGERLGELHITYKLRISGRRCSLDVDKSSFQLMAKLDRVPLIRWDYDGKSHRRPISHTQVNAHRGALSHLLSRLDHRTPHSLQSLHLPAGGRRFGPCLEDIVEFLIVDCGFAGAPHWRATVRAGRARWRRTQTHFAVLDAPRTAAAALSGMGYVVHPPSGGEPPERLEELSAW